MTEMIWYSRGCGGRGEARARQWQKKMQLFEAEYIIGCAPLVNASHCWNRSTVYISLHSRTRAHAHMHTPTTQHKNNTHNTQHTQHTHIAHATHTHNTHNAHTQHAHITHTTHTHNTHKTHTHTQRTHTTHTHTHTHRPHPTSPLHVRTKNME